MKKLPAAALVALAFAASPSFAAPAPVHPVPGAVCNLYLIDTTYKRAAFTNVTETLAQAPAAATFVDDAETFRPSKKVQGVHSSWGMWTGWMKAPAAGTYTFLCQRDYSDSSSPGNGTLYSVWVNGELKLEAVGGQHSFDAELGAGFNAVTIIAESYSHSDYPLALSFKRKGSVKEPIPLRPADMFYEDEQ